MRISDASEMPTNSRIPADHPFHRGVRREHSAMDIDTDRVAAGYKSAPGFNPSPRNRSKRRALPPVPTNVPRPVSSGRRHSLALLLPSCKETRFGC
jgi:hypothetical protein